MNGKNWLLSSLCALTLAACGGADTHTAEGPGTGGTGGGGGVGIAGTPSSSGASVLFASGSIASVSNGATPFMVVADQPFALSSAVIFTLYAEGPSTSFTLKPGQTVEVVAKLSSTGVPQKPDIHVREQLHGPIAGIDGPTFTLLGQTVEVSATTTQFDATQLPQGLPALQNGDLVTVYAEIDAATGHYKATRIELDTDVPTRFMVEGVVSSLDASGQLVQLGTDPTTYACPTASRLSSQPGDTVRVWLSATQDADGKWLTTPDQGGTQAQASQCTPVPTASQGLTQAKAAVQGLVDTVGSSLAPWDTRYFTVNGLQVDASALRGCTVCFTLQAGDAVQVEGTLQWPVLKATKVTKAVN
jgi:hypothetical protein